MSQDGRGWPSMSTKHAPHSPTPQPNRGPARPRSWRSTSSSGVSGSARTVCLVPLTVSCRILTLPIRTEYAFVCRFGQERARQTAELGGRWVGEQMGEQVGERLGEQVDERVAMAISHWGPRFTTNGVTAGDFERITSGLRRWADWCAAWCVAGAEHE